MNGEIVEQRRPVKPHLLCAGLSGRELVQLIIKSGPK